MMNRNNLYLALGMVIATVACKLAFGNNLSWSGFSPVIAIAVFSGFISHEKNNSFILPLLALLVSDVVIQILHTQDLFPYAGFYAGQWKNYLLLLSCTFIGWILKGKSYSSLLAGGLAAPTLYFLVSNFMVWYGLTEVVYTRDAKGLMNCYTAALPFYRNALAATLVFLPLILVSYNMLSKKKSSLVLA
ncbi:MAG: hypothetical protein RL115_1425 [Bacteroidota bacterium]|jgi:hypothetical protein